MEQTLTVSSSLASRKRNILRSHPYRTAVFAALICVVAVGVSFPAPAQAQEQGIVGQIVGAVGGALFNIGYWVVAKVAFGLAYIASWILGIFIAIAAFLVGIALKLNVDVVSSAFVTTGFNVALSVANLGFVIGMIVMALMTIIRYQPYGVKQMLWRIVVMAIVVNFGLLIAGSILGVANSLTSYWLEGTNPAGSNNSYANFASSLAGAFNPQTSFTETATVEFEGNSAAADTGAGFAALLSPIASVVITIVTLLMIIIALMTLAVMLIVRLVTLSVLLVLLPLAWVSWVFPLTRGNWEKWWHSFLSQAFFPPIVVFFMWLVITTGQQMGGLDTIKAETYSSSNPFGSFLGSLILGLVAPFAQGAVFAGLVLGGIIVSQKMGIRFASNGIAAAQSAGKAFGGYVGRRAGSAARGAAQKEVRVPGTQKRISLQKGINALQTSSVPGISRIPGMSAIGRAGQSLIDRGGKGIVKNLQSELKSKDSGQLAENVSGNMDRDKQIAHVNELVSRGDIGLLKSKGIGGKSLDSWMTENKKAFADRGMAKQFMDLEKSSGASVDMLNKQQAKDQAAKQAGASAYVAAETSVKDNERELEEEARKVGRAKEVEKSAKGSRAKDIDELESLLDSAPEAARQMNAELARLQQERQTALQAGNSNRVVEIDKRVGEVNTNEQKRKDRTTELQGKLNGTAEFTAFQNAKTVRVAAEKERDHTEASLVQSRQDLDAVPYNPDVQQYMKASAEFDDAVKNFAGSLSRSDFAKMDLNVLFGKWDNNNRAFGLENEGQFKQRQQMFTSVIAQSPELASSAVAKMKHSQQQTFSDQYDVRLKGELDVAQRAAKEPSDPVRQRVAEERLAEVSRAVKARQDIIYNNMLGYLHAEGATPAAGPAPAAPPPPSP
ncbi:MAG: hypothetical protein RL681_450 [Candidatus Parcubacteria bacterium]|jgi:hypothetical protein